MENNKTLEIKAYLKPTCGWSMGVRAIMKKYALDYQDIDIINKPENYAEMVQKSGQSLSPCVEVNGIMLADVSGEEVENYLLSNNLVEANDNAPEAPINKSCSNKQHEQMKTETVRFF